MGIETRMSCGHAPHAHSVSQINLLLTFKVARYFDAAGGVAAALAGADIWSSVTGDVSTGKPSAAHAGNPPSSTATLQHQTG
jgi:hypothetical protein